MTEPQSAEQQTQDADVQAQEAAREHLETPNAGQEGNTEATSDDLVAQDGDEAAQ